MLIVCRQKRQESQSDITKILGNVGGRSLGPMPMPRHVVVLQDLGSRYPVAKLVKSTKADEVIPALDEIYTEYGCLDTQISDNGPPFNSNKMQQFQCQ